MRLSVFQQSLKNFLYHLRGRPEFLFSFLLLVALFFFLSGQSFYNRLVLPRSSLEVLPTLPEPASYPVKIGEIPAPNLTARAAVVVDASSRLVLFAKSPDARLLPASTTKVMTALVALETYHPEKIIKVGKLDIEGQTMGLVAGEEISVENLLYGLLLVSANDAAEVLAAAYPGGRQVFIDRMNQRAESFSLGNTHFANPTGIDAPGHFTTVSDLTLLATEALKEPFFVQIVSTDEITVSDLSGKIVHQLENINQLLGEVEGIVGGKTGWTEAAGECLVVITEREGHRIVTAVLASQDRFGETRALIEWAFASHRWQSPSL